MRSAYQQGVRQTGRHKGFSDDRMQDLLDLGEQGPLDYNSNKNMLRDGNRHNMEKISNKIQGNINNLQRQEREFEYMNQQAMQKQAAATASSKINGFYGGVGNTTVPDFKTKNQTYHNQFYQRDHKEVVNELYNKR